jgi:hypothetical protein
MRQIYKYVLFLILLNIFVAGTGFLLKSLSCMNLFYKDIVVLSLLFSVISAIVITIFLRGQTREPDSQTMHTLVSVSLKFLLDMILALLWFVVSKKNSLTSVFVFFVIYLALTLLTIFVILKVLRNSFLLKLNRFENKGSY